MIAHRGETARLAGQFGSFVEEQRKIREVFDERLQRMDARLSAELGALGQRVSVIENHHSEHSGAQHVIGRIVEWGVLSVVGIMSAVAIWLADHTGGH